MVQMLNPEQLENLDDEQLKQLRALMDPLRMKLFMLLHKPMTVTQLANSLKVERHSLYYQVKVLLKADLIKKVETHQVGHIVETVYQAKDMRLRHRPGLEPNEPYQQFVLTMLQQTIEDFYKAMTRYDRLRGGADRLTLEINSDNFESKLKKFEEITQEYIEKMSELEDEDGDISYSISIAQFKL